MDVATLKQPVAEPRLKVRPSASLPDESDLFCGALEKAEERNSANRSFTAEASRPHQDSLGSTISVSVNPRIPQP